MHLIWAGLILGVVVTWGVPIVAGILKSIAPTSVQAYLPASTVPNVDMTGVVTALVYGLILALMLHVLRRVGVRGAG